MIVFDTDVISHVIRSSPPISLLKRLAMVDPQDQATTSISVGELVYGAQRSARPEHFLSLIETRVLTELKVLPFDTRAAQVYGGIRAALEKQGSVVPEPDLRIAAICLLCGASLATGNLRHFGRIPGLACEDWLAGCR